jgi:hypothetical protein
MHIFNFLAYYRSFFVHILIIFPPITSHSYIVISNLFHYNYKIVKIITCILKYNTI